MHLSTVEKKRHFFVNSTLNGFCRQQLWRLMHIGSIWKEEELFGGWEAAAAFSTLIAHSKHSFGAKTLTVAVAGHFGLTT